MIQKYARKHIPYVWLSLLFFYDFSSCFSHLHREQQLIAASSNERGPQDDKDQSGFTVV
jgi:hypothetical protein